MFSRFTGNHRVSTGDPGSHLDHRGNESTMSGTMAVSDMSSPTTLENHHEKTQTPSSSSKRFPAFLGARKYLVFPWLNYPSLLLILMAHKIQSTRSTQVMKQLYVQMHDPLS
jgi:hypothetical protein